MTSTSEPGENGDSERESASADDIQAWTRLRNWLQRDPEGSRFLETLRAGHASIDDLIAFLDDRKLTVDLGGEARVEKLVAVGNLRGDIHIHGARSSPLEVGPPAPSGYSATQPVFIQYLNPEILRLYGIEAHFPLRDVVRISLLLTRYAILASEGTLIMPASYLFEVPYIGRVLGGLGEVLEAGLLAFASPSADLAQYVPKKRREYRAEEGLFPGYFEYEDAPIRDASGLLWVPRLERSSSADIATAWRNSLREQGFWEQLLRRGEHRPTASKLETAIAKVPDRLDGLAFIARYAIPLIPADLDAADRGRVALLISRTYLLSYLQEFRAFVLCDTPFGGLDCGIPMTGDNGAIQRLSWRALKQVFGFLELVSPIEQRLSWSSLLVLRGEPPLRWLVETVAQDAILGDNRLQRAALAAAERRDEWRRRSARALFDQVRDTLWQFWDAIARVPGIWPEDDPRYRSQR